MEFTEILKKPLITEKISTLDARVKGSSERYAFIVHPQANKIQIADAVEKMYGVEVVAVNTINHKGKSKVKYTKKRIVEGRTASYKKAIVTLKEGDFIDFYGSI
jgi:large subunit ribosomal protein L23